MKQQTQDELYYFDKLTIMSRSKIGTVRSKVKMTKVLAFCTTASLKPTFGAPFTKGFFKSQLEVTGVTFRALELLDEYLKGINSVLSG